MSIPEEVKSRVFERWYGGSLRHALRNRRVTLATIAHLIEAMQPRQRLYAVRSLSSHDQQRLWELAEGSRVSMVDIVPAGLVKGQMVRHYGKNSLPVHTHFEKRFCLADRGPAEGKELWGYNFQALAPITGPGYFVAYEDPETNSVAIDYRRVPPDMPPGWPKVEPNEKGLSNFIYAGMVDHMRRVSTHVTIGRAWKGGKWMPNWFVLCREELRN